MHDPIPPLPLLQRWSEPLADALGLQTLPLHVHEILGAFAVYHTIFRYVAPPLSAYLLPNRYKKLSAESTLRWNMHCVSMAQSTMISVLALWVMINDHERRQMTFEERMWGYTGAAGMVQGLAAGYFLWDFSVMLQHTDVFGLPMLTHAFSCFCVFSLGFRPVLNYYGCVFMLYELSTPFLNIHWFLDKLDMTGSPAQLYNGAILIAVFFSVRLLYGGYSSIYIYSDVWRALSMKSYGLVADKILAADMGNPTMQYAGRHILPLWTALVYLAGHVTLNSLNVFWFGKMIKAIRKRVPKATEKVE